MIYKIDRLTYVNLSEVAAITAESYKSSAYNNVTLKFNSGKEMIIKDIIETEFKEMISEWSRLNRGK